MRNGIGMFFGSRVRLVAEASDRRLRVVLSHAHLLWDARATTKERPDICLIISQGESSIITQASCSL